MSNADIRGRFIWHELMTTDPDAAEDFYSSIVPWKTQPSGMPSYTLWMSGKNRAGGLMELPAEDASGTPPHWLIYVGTSDVDATVEEAQKLGGKVLKPAADIPNVGRFAVLSDPQGAAFAVFNPAPGSDDGVSPGGGLGDFTWHELATTDLDSALPFYSELFGWSKGATHDMGAMGIYQIISHGGQDVGGIYKVRDASVPPSWLSYARVADASKAASAVKAGGGRVLNGPIEVPGGSWIVMLLDPQGGPFAVVEAPRQAAAKRPPTAPAEKSAAAGAASKPAKSAPAKKPAAPKPAAKVAPAKTPAKKTAAKSAPAKTATKKAAKKAKKAAKKAVKKAPAKRAAGKKSTTAKRGSGSAKAGKKAATSRVKSKGKAKKKR
jgi:predicted enzyme related to lactoylglutathione lyase